MKITIRTPQMQDYDRFSAIMDQVQQMHVEWRPDVYKPASPLITKELFGELLKGDSWYIAPRQMEALLVFWKSSSAMWKARRR